MPLLQPDDLNVGDFITVHSIKVGDEESQPQPIFGQAFTILSIERPFVAVEHYASKTRITLDERFMNFQRVSKEFAEAQVDPRPQGDPLMMLMGAIGGRQRRKGN